MLRHGSHPKCSSCGGVLYRSQRPGWRSKPGDPYIYCRSCGHVEGESAPVTEKEEGGMSEKRRLSRAEARRRRSGETPKKKEPVEQKPVEPTEQPALMDIGALRSKITPLLDSALVGQPKQAVAMFLTIAAEHVGEKEAAAVLIAKYGLSVLGFKV